MITMDHPAWSSRFRRDSHQKGDAYRQSLAYHGLDRAPIKDQVVNVVLVGSCTMGDCRTCVRRQLLRDTRSPRRADARGSGCNRLRRGRADGMTECSSTREPVAESGVGPGMTGDLSPGSVSVSTVTYFRPPGHRCAHLLGAPDARQRRSRRCYGSTVN